MLRCELPLKVHSHLAPQVYDTPVNSILAWEASGLSAPPVEALPEPLVEKILSRLAFNRHPQPTPEGLRSVYSHWCRAVPFDNIRKLIHVRAQNLKPLPGTTAVNFFEAWLKYGTGGTCWPGAGALHALLRSLGFHALRGIGTMMAAPNLPPNHGTVLVNLDDQKFLVDSSMLHGEPLNLTEGSAGLIDHPAWGVKTRWQNEKCFVLWRPLARLEGFQCRVERFGATSSEFQSFYERTRAWSPFNYELSIRLNRGETVIGVAFGHVVTILADGKVIRTPLAPDQRVRFLVEDIGITEGLAQQLPLDVPTPSPPGSRGAQRLAV